MVSTFTIFMGIVLTFIGILEATIGMYIYFRRQRDDIVRSFTIFALGVALWVISNGISRLSPELNQFFDRLSFAGAAIIVAAFVYFSWSFPYKKIELKTSQIVLLFLPALIFTLTLFTSNYLVGGPSTLKSFGYSLDYRGTLYGIFNVYILSFFVWSFVNLIQKLKSADGYHLWQLRILLIALGVAAIFGVFSNLVLPWFLGISSLYWLGPLFSIVWLGAVVYIIMKR